MADSEEKNITEEASTDTEEKKEIVKSVFDSVLNEIKEKNDEPRILEKINESEAISKESELKNSKDSAPPKNPFFKEKTTSPEKKQGKVIETVDLDLDSDTEKEENSSNGKEKKSQSVTGVVFQFDENFILFEFSLRSFDGGKIKLEEDLIGQISPQKLVCNSKDNSVIPAGTKSDKISNYVQSGDEIRVEVNLSCFFFKYIFSYYSNPSCFQLTFTCVEDEKEICKIFDHISLFFFSQNIKTIHLQFQIEILNIRKNSGNFQVEARDDLKTFTYVEDEEEIGADGKVTRTTRNVQIKPSWLALEGKLLTDSTNAGQVEKESEKLGQEDLLVLEDQLENMFDYEPESDNEEEENSSKEKKKSEEKAGESGDDEIMLIEEVKFDETESKKGSSRSFSLKD